ncbi:gluconate 2-dehydrogenase subunit 3 family protein [Halegenticoccus soli]|uniref:gluconate 2-dehydrogenase subunit 3 family protein n=1 Tax=Halegenticoccus soli TaxID=1985678 RepID=UPI000C6CFF97|nr:gluconate 2-dehydrogenase subunit 3 family protein [Halegenticoccus soli]
MELTRRDALAALAAGGVVLGGGAALTWEELRAEEGGNRDGAALDDREVETLAAVATALYPSEATGVPAFVETYVVGRIRDRRAYAEGVKSALSTLDSYAESWYGGRYAALDGGARDGLLREVGVATAEPNPDGLDPERLRYYLVNELLYAFYASPAGGRLVGIENPQGYPGGTESYRRGPER